MRIGLDVSQTGGFKAGCGYLADGLAHALAEMDSRDEIILYPFFGDQSGQPAGPHSACRINRPNVEVLRNRRACTPEFWARTDGRAEDDLGRPDVVHSNNFYCPRNLKTARLVYTLYDLSFLEHPELTTEANRTLCFAGVFDASLYADCIVAISQYTRSHFLSTFPHCPPEKVRVAYPGCRYVPRAGLSRPSRLGFLRPDEYWLSVGTLEPRKNHARLIQAYARLKAQQKQTFPLVLAGGKGWLVDDLENLLEELALQRDVVRLGYVDEQELQWLYQNCFCMVYPSLFEGFGLPVLEAMTLGAAVIVSGVTSLPEIVGDAGLLVDPRDVDSIAAALRTIAADPARRAGLRQQAAQRAKAFSWGSFAQEMLECYRSVCRQQQAGRGGEA